jgi:MFS transporter, NNP family, nitrate/nitrite transporter
MSSKTISEITNNENDGRNSVLFWSTAAFTAFFAVWLQFGILGIKIREDLGLTDGQFATLISIPVLTGSLLRLPMGILTDKFGGRILMTLLLLFTAIPCFLISGVQTYQQLIIYALLMGLAGTSFAVGIAWNAAWFPKDRQGFALGMFGAGNVGASVTKLIGPALIALVPVTAGSMIPGGWRFVPFMYGFLMIIMAVLLFLFTPKQDKKPGHAKAYGKMFAPLRFVQVWRFGFYYIVVFGAYVALSSWLPKYYVDVYGIPLGAAGLLTTIFIFPASLLRPFGGWLSDKYGPRQVMFSVFYVIAACCIPLALIAPQALGVVLFTALMAIVGVAMGIGKASNYKMVPTWYPNDVGAVGGMVGLIGGLGGWFLPKYFFAPVAANTGNPASIFWILLGFTVVCIVWMNIAVSSIKAGRIKPVIDASAPAGD